MGHRPASDIGCSVTGQEPGVACDTAEVNNGVTNFLFCKITAARKGTVRAVMQNVDSAATAEAR